MAWRVRPAIPWRIIVRRTLQRPAESLVAVVALGLGIGFSISMVNILQGILMPPFSLVSPHRLVTIEVDRDQSSGPVDGSPGSGPDGIDPEELRTWQRETHT